jgi:hypothetical protein
MIDGYKQLIKDFYLSMSLLHPPQHSEILDLQHQEDEWWHLPTQPYLKYSDIPQSSRWMGKAIPRKSYMTLAVDGNNLNSPTP